ncbi:PAS domain-containing sensor histidine kinase [Rhodonellum sp.]|uniref:PAS domain-containing sensor histidine kinase n=1 Tax=Rhodonellum sp. TaxID=2231180 RepID=UPI00272548BF|nr:PAS domain-containing sensor histidine kinase [Rhodonellum sp.]MDO9553818.1 PAS domain S-box protein [Rhodonellum sp.]
MKDTGKKTESEFLRKKAEELLKTSHPDMEGTNLDAKTLKLIHELEVHQIELELQNDELIRAKIDAQNAADKYIELYDFAPSGYFTLSQEGIILEVNLFGSQMIGKERSRLRKTPFGIYVSESSKPIFRQFLSNVFKSEAKEVCELTLSSFGKAPVFAYVTGILTESGEECILTVVDITEQKKLESSIQDLSLIATHTDNLVLITDVYGQIEYVNKAFEKLTEFSLEEIKGRKPGSFLQGPETDPEHIAAMRKGIQELKPFTQEILNYSKSGKKYWLSVTIDPIFDSQGALLKFIGVEWDITPQKSLEKSLKEALESERYFLSQIMKTNISAVLEVNANGRITFANKALENLVGLSVDKVISRTINDPRWKITDPQGKPVLDDQLPFSLVMKTGKPVNNICQSIERPDGQKRILLINAAPLNFEDGKPSSVVFSISDITKEIETRHALEGIKSKLESILNEMTDVVWSLSLIDYQMLFASPSIEKLYGISQAEFLKDNSYWKKSIHPDDKSVVDEIYQELDTVGSFEKEYRIIAKNKEIKWVLNRGKVIADTEGKPIRLDGYLTDITEKKKKEEEINSYLQITKEQNERLKNFAHIVSHNLRTHSANIIGLLDVLKFQHPEFSENQLFSMLFLASENLGETLHNLAQVVGMGSSKENLITINLSRVIESAVTNVYSIAKEANVAIENQVKPDTEIMGLPAYMDSVILNFLTNGIKYKAENRKSYVKLSAKTQNGYLVLSIEDNGLGINLEKYGSKLFGMYKTFHNHPDARGIGLFITKNQVETMGGKIEVESQVGVGTTFKIFFKQKVKSNGENQQN